MQATNPDVDWFFNKPTPWKQSYEKLRMIVLGCGLAEELKWGCPCYTINGRNVVLIHGFKEYCALLFHKGALLQDKAGLLVQQTKNVQSARQVRFRSLQDVVRLERQVKNYIQQAIEIEKSGQKVVLKKTSQFDMPDEFAARLKASPAFRDAFRALTPGRQRGYLLYFSSAKQSTTRIARIDRSIERIMAGKGLDD